MDDTQDPKDAARFAAVEEAVELLREESAEEAIPMLRAALERDPANVYAHFYLGTALATQGKHGPALAAFTEAERRAPGYLGAVVSRGWCLYELGRFSEAVRAGQRALDLRSEDPDALYLMGASYAEQGQRAHAIAHLQRFLATRPEVEAKHDAEALLSALRGQAKPFDPAE